MHQGAWCTIDLGAVPDFQPWKPETLEGARAVRWHPVNVAALQVLAEHGPHADLLEVAWERFADLGEGLRLLLEQPIIATAEHITDGGHRIIAMLEQGERWTVGWSVESGGPDPRSSGHGSDWASDRPSDRASDQPSSRGRNGAASLRPEAATSQHLPALRRRGTDPCGVRAEDLGRRGRRRS